MGYYEQYMIIGGTYSDVNANIISHFFPIRHLTRHTGWLRNTLIFAHNT